MLSSEYGFSDIDAFRAVGALGGKRGDPNDPSAMLKLSHWVALGLATLGTAHLVTVACREQGKSTKSGPYTPTLAGVATELYAIRPIEPRVTGGFHYAPYQPDQEAVLKEASTGWNRLLQEEEGTVPETLGAAAIARLFGGDPERAHALLQKALTLSEKDPRLLSDLAAASLSRGEKAGTPYDFVQALAAADRALEIAPSLAEARFNQALALTRLGLTPAAQKAWRAYRALDPDSGWTQEADRHLQHLSKPREADLWKTDRNRLDVAALAGKTEEVRRIVQAYRQPARLYVEDELLGQWAADRSDRPLIIARAVAEALGVRALQEEVGAVEEAVREGGGRLNVLVRGHALYAKARGLHEQQKYLEAGPLFHQAAAALEEGRSPFAAWPRLYLSIIDHHHADQPGAIRALQELRREVEEERYAPLLATIDWMIGQARGEQGPIASALPATQSARRLFEAAGETANRAAMDGILARIYAELGDFDRAWPHHIAALQDLPRLYKPRRIQNVLSEAVYSLRQTGDLAPALYFQEMLVGEALRAGNPVGKTIALRDQAALLDALGRTDDAVATLSRTRDLAAEIEDPQLRQRVEMETLVAEARILRESHPEAAIRVLDQAMAVSLAAGNRHLLIQMLQERAACSLALGQEQEAESNLEAGLVELETQRRVLDDPSLRVFFADQGRALLEERIALQNRRGETAEATLDTAERLRARTLLDSVGGVGQDGWPEPKPARQIVAALPRGTALVEYLWLHGSLAAWIVTRDGVDRVDLRARQDRVEALVDRFLKDVRDQRDTSSVTRELHRWLIAPLVHRLAGASTLILIPDGALCRLSFAALQDENGRYLLEDHGLATAPSASVYLSLAQRYQALSATPPATALLVGEPRIDRALFQTLTSLPASSEEIAALGRLYSRAVVLTGDKATAERFLAAFPSEDVLHYTGHTVTPPGADAPSLLLTASAGSTGLLPPEKIRCTRPPGTRLAVLAGCRTAEGRLSRNEGTLGLSRAFLAAGVPVVVASAWDADDKPTFLLFRRFHELLRSGADPMTALRQAQLDLLRSTDRAFSSPRAWAAFQVIGGAVAAGDLSPPIPTASP